MNDTELSIKSYFQSISFGKAKKVAVPFPKDLGVVFSLVNVLKRDSTASPIMRDK